MRTVMSTRFLAAVLALTAGPLALPSAGRCDDKLRVTVVAILATDQNTKVDDRVKCIAAEVHKLEPKLTGFRLKRTTCRSLVIGGSDKFPLVENQEASVLVQRGTDKDNRVCLKVKPPELGSILYTCKCGKFFPIMTRYQTKDNERLIIAVMVKPCEVKK